MEDRSELREFVTTRLSQLKTVRARGDERRIRCCAFMNHRVDDLHSPVSRMTIFNTVPIDAVQTTARGIAGYMLSPSIRWFRYQTMGRNFEPSDNIRGANDWLEHVANKQYEVYANSRFYPVTLEALMDVLIVGTSYEMTSDEVSEGRIVYDCYSPFECYIAEDGQRRVNTWFREYTLTADEAYDKWGDECPPEVIDMVKRKQGSMECKFVHAIFPRKKAEVADVPVPASASKRFASVHYSAVGDAVFHVSGYDEFPLAIHRYDLSSGSPYGTSLVDKNLELIIEANDVKRKQLKATAKLLDPPTFVPSALKGRVDLNPGSILYGDAQNGVPTPLQTMISQKDVREDLMEINAMCTRMLFADLFNILMRQDRQRTAYEVQELKGEGLVLLSAIIGNMQEEKLTPLVLRTFAIMYRNHMVEEPPEELKKAWSEGRIKIELDGPLATQMKQFHQTTGMAQGLQWISSWAQIFPESMLNIDPDEGMRQGATAYGFPQSAIREKADVDKIKRQQAENQQRVQQQQDALLQSQVAKNLGMDAQQMAQAQAAQGSDAQRLMQNGQI